MIEIALSQYLVLITGGGASVAIYRGTATGRVTYPKYYLWPIPAAEMRNNQNMVQNTGW